MSLGSSAVRLFPGNRPCIVPVRPDRRSPDGFVSVGRETRCGAAASPVWSLGTQGSIMEYDSVPKKP